MLFGRGTGVEWGVEPRQTALMGSAVDGSLDHLEKEQFFIHWNLAWEWQ